MKIEVPLETREVLAKGLTKLDDRILEAAIALTRPENGVITIKSYIVEQLLQVVVDALRKHVSEEARKVAK